MWVARAMLLELVVSTVVEPVDLVLLEVAVRVALPLVVVAHPTCAWVAFPSQTV